MNALYLLLEDIGRSLWRKPRYVLFDDLPSTIYLAIWVFLHDCKDGFIG